MNPADGAALVREGLVQFAGSRVARRGAWAAAALAMFGLGRLTAGSAPVAAKVTPAVAQAMALEKGLDDLEARMHVSAGLVVHQQDLAARHEQVSALACASASDQMALGARLEDAAAAKRKRLRASGGKGVESAANVHADPREANLVDAGGGGDVVPVSYHRHASTVTLAVNRGSTHPFGQ